MYLHSESCNWLSLICQSSNSFHSFVSFLIMAAFNDANLSVVLFLFVEAVSVLGL